MLEVENLHLYFGDSHILRGINLSIAAGENVGLIGPNGSGKTTFFNCLSGFNRQSEGKILLNNNDISRTGPAKRASSGLGRLFQNFGIFREMTVLENIIVALESNQGPTLFPWSAQHKRNRAAALELLSHVGLETKAEDKAGTLSGGQLRLLEINRLIAFGAELFLLDEPTAGVSPKMKGEIEAAIHKLQERNSTVLIIEHDINFIHRLCQRVIVLDVGTVVLDGSPETIRSDPKLQEIYFGTDATPAEGQ